MEIVRPLIGKSERQPFDLRFKVTPQERFDAESLYNTFLSETCPQIMACRGFKEAKIYTSIDTRTTFFVKELVYPGESAEEIEDKWIYAIYVAGEPRFLAEIYAKNAECWNYRLNPTFSDDHLAPLPLTGRGRVELPIKPNEAASNFAFFLSPLRLTSEGVKILQESSEKLINACVRAKRENQQTILAVVPDPFHWAIDAHDKYYLPALEKWHEYVFDPQRQAKVFIAGVLKNWIETGKDNLGVKNELQAGEPNRFIDNYKREEESRRVKAEEASAYLGNCFDAIEHRAVERSAMDADEQTLSIAFQQWGIISERLIETAQGRKFAAQLCSDPTRLPKRYLFPENPSSALMDYFPNFRYAWLAAVAAFAELFPASVKSLREKLIREGVRDKDLYIEKVIQQNVKKYLESVGINVKSRQLETQTLNNLLTNSQHETQILDNLKANRPPANGVNPSKEKYLKKYFEKLVEKSGAGEIALPTPTKFEASVDKITESADKLHKNAEPHFTKVRYQIGMVIEIVNLTLAISSYSDANAETKYERTWSLVGASADMLSFLTDFTKEALEGFGKRAIGAVGGAAGFVGGVCQMVDEERQLIEGFSKNDYGITVGHSIAAAGAGVAAIGGGLILYEAIMGGALVGGPIGAIVAGIGAVLIIGGNLIASWFSKNPYEHFAKACFLGDSHDAETVYHDWAAGGLPTSDILKEAKILIALLANFRLERVGVFGNMEQGFVKITPGYLTSDSEFHVKIEQKYLFPKELTGKETATHSLEAQLSVRQTDDKVIFLKGSMKPELERCQIKRDQSGNIEGILICCKPDLLLSGDIMANQVGAINYNDFPHDWRSNHWVPCNESKVSVRVEMSKRSISAPTGGNYVQLDAFKDEAVNSLDTSKWV